MSWDEIVTRHGVTAEGSDRQSRPEGKAKTWPRSPQFFISEMRCDEPWRKKKKKIALK